MTPEFKAVLAEAKELDRDRLDLVGLQGYSRLIGVSGGSTVCSDIIISSISRFNCNCKMPFFNYDDEFEFFLVDSANEVFRLFSFPVLAIKALMGGDLIRNRFDNALIGITGSQQLSLNNSPAINLGSNAQCKPFTLPNPIIDLDPSPEQPTSPVENPVAQTIDINMQQLNIDLLKAENKASYIESACNTGRQECPETQMFQLLYAEAEVTDHTRWHDEISDVLKCKTTSEDSHNCFQDGDRFISNAPTSDSLFVLGSQADIYSDQFEDEEVEGIEGFTVQFVTIDGQKYLVNKCRAASQDTVFYGVNPYPDSPLVTADGNQDQYDVSHIPIRCDYQNNLALTLTDKYKQVSSEAKRVIRRTEVTGLLLTAAVGAVAFAFVGPAAVGLLTALNFEASTVATMGAIAQAAFAAGNAGYMTYAAVKSGIELKECTNDECRMHARFSLISDSVFAAFSFADFAGQVRSGFGPSEKASGMGKLLQQWDVIRPQIENDSLYTPLLEQESKPLAAGILDKNFADIIRGSGRWADITEPKRASILDTVSKVSWDDLSSEEFWEELDEALPEGNNALTEADADEFANKVEEAGNCPLGLALTCGQGVQPFDADFASLAEDIDGSLTPRIDSPTNDRITIDRSNDNGTIYRTQFRQSGTRSMEMTVVRLFRGDSAQYASDVLFSDLLHVNTRWNDYLLTPTEVTAPEVVSHTGVSNAPTRAVLDSHGLLPRGVDNYQVFTPESEVFQQLIGASSSNARTTNYFVDRINTANSLYGVNGTQYEISSIELDWDGGSYDLDIFITPRGN